MSEKVKSEKSDFQYEYNKFGVEYSKENAKWNI